MLRLHRYIITGVMTLLLTEQHELPIVITAQMSQRPASQPQNIKHHKRIEAENKFKNVSDEPQRYEALAHHHRPNQIPIKPSNK
ncbi:hypothetical protein HanXRQr2_Chr13g0605341 [Helianthus annuus]|uniref:Uncharacterized protein n=1 Tax=Helianthus annuus TaxID=4232 RepID=A0A9K3EK70_HELAN|nr:hypothetical protein HanXRQr2_Chr13g0605341 [Helianthus annuus]KAJ0850653.1 hypothetical protein HanPSC8_Chr13g0583351 [Helianthus annuus]